MTKRPVIGLNMSMELYDKYEKFGLIVPLGYVDSVVGAGGIPLCIPPCPDITIINEFLSLLDGIVLIGGDDYWPEHYGGHPQPENELMHERRDIFDMELTKLVLQETELPVLGICGGHQLITIAQGGALVQDIKAEWNFAEDCLPLPHSKEYRSEDENIDFRHPVRLDADSFVARVIQVVPENILMTNSTHHQSVHPHRVGRYLRASAWSPDGVIEAIEPSSDSPWALSGRFVLGIQWHPEQLQDEEPHRNIFRAFIKAALRK